MDLLSDASCIMNKGKIQKLRLPEKDGSKILKEYETLLKNIIFSEQVLEQIRTREKKVPVENTNQSCLTAYQKSGALSNAVAGSNGLKFRRKPVKCQRSDSAVKSTDVARNLQFPDPSEQDVQIISTCLPTQTTLDPMITDPMDPVTILATQLLQEDPSVIPQQQNNHNTLNVQQTNSLGQLLPRLRKLAVLTGSSELIRLTEQAQNAARKILHYYGSFLDRAPPPVNEYSFVDNPCNDPIGDRMCQSAVDCQKRNSMSRGTQATLDVSSCKIEKVDASTTTRDASSLTLGKSKMSNGMPKNNAQSTQSKHVCDAQTSTKVDTAVHPHSQNEDVFDHEPRCDKNHQLCSAQLRKQLASEQAQARNLSSQLLYCQRGVEKMRLDYVQREAELQADLRACQDRESQLIKSNTELRNELRLAEYQISQLQFRLTLVGRLSPPNTSDKCQIDAATSDRTLLSDFNYTASRSQSSDPRNSPLCYDPQSKIVHCVRNKPRGSYVDPDTAPVLMKSKSIGSPLRNACGQHLMPDVSVQKHKHDPIFTSHDRATTSQPDVGIKVPLEPHRREDESMNGTEDQSMASVTSRSSGDSSSLHTVDEMEFRSGLAQLDERIDSMRRALLSRNVLDTP